MGKILTWQRERCKGCIASMERALLSLHGVTVLPGAHRAPLHESSLAPQLHFCTAPDIQDCLLQLQTLVVDTQHPGAVDTSKKQPAKLYYHSPVSRSSPFPALSCTTCVVAPREKELT